ncbi:MAG: DUF3558 domain-containing protein [Sciscionella sp.]
MPSVALSHQIGALLAAAALLGSLAGCASTRGTPTSTGGPSTTGRTAGTPAPATSSPADQAPKVIHPLDASQYVSNPCKMLSAAQLKSFGVASKGVPSHAAGSPGCDWTTSSENGVGVGIITADKNGLTHLYQARKVYAYFVPMMIAGYPAVAADTGDQRSQGGCPIAIGISDTQVISAQYTVLGSGSSTACAKTKQLGAAMIKHLKERS